MTLRSSHIVLSLSSIYKTFSRFNYNNLSLHNTYHQLASLLGAIIPRTAPRYAATQLEAIIR